jgi:thioredoxin-like negative regulator of GroEL
MVSSYLDMTFVVLLAILPSFSVWSSGVISEYHGSIQHISPFELESMVKIHSIVVASFSVRSDHCDVMLQQMAQASNIDASKIRYVFVDAAQHPAVRQIYGIVRHPTLKIFVSAKMQPGEYQGPLLADDVHKWAVSYRIDTISSLTDSALEAGVAPSSTVLQLSGPQLHTLFLNPAMDIFVMFYESGCPAVEHMAAELATVATAFRDHPTLTIARLDAEAHPDAARAYSAHGLPAFYFFARPDPIFGFRPSGAVYADVRAAPAMTRFLARKRGVPQAGLPAVAGGEQDTSEGSRDPPGWIFRPAGSRLAA